MHNANLLIANARPDDFKFVEVVFKECGHASKPYMFKTFMDVTVGGHVVIEVPSGLTIVEVTKVTPALEANLQSQLEVKWIIGLVDREQYDQCIKMEAGLTSKLNIMEAERSQRLILSALEEEYGIDEIKELTESIDCAPSKL